MAGECLCHAVPTMSHYLVWVFHRYLVGSAVTGWCDLQGPLKWFHQPLPVAVLSEGLSVNHNGPNYFCFVHFKFFKIRDNWHVVKFTNFKYTAQWIFLCIYLCDPLPRSSSRTFAATQKVPLYPLSECSTKITSILNSIIIN